MSNYISSDTGFDSESTLRDYNSTPAADSDDSYERSDGSFMYDSDDSANWGCLTSDSQPDDASFLLSRTPSVSAHSIYTISSGGSRDPSPSESSQDHPPAAPEANLSAELEDGTAARPIHVASSPSLASDSKHAMPEDHPFVEDMAPLIQQEPDWSLTLFDDDGEYRTERFELWLARTSAWLESTQVQTIDDELDRDVSLVIPEDRSFTQSGETIDRVDHPEIIDLTGLTDDEEFEIVDVPTSPTIPTPAPSRMLRKLKMFCSTITTKTSVESDAPAKSSGHPSARDFFKRMAFGQERSPSPPSPPQRSTACLKRKWDDGNGEDDELSAAKKQKMDSRLLAMRAKVQRPRAITSRR